MKCNFVNFCSHYSSCWHTTDELDSPQPPLAHSSFPFFELQFYFILICMLKDLLKCNNLVQEKKFHLEKCVPSNPNSSFPLRSPTLPFTAFIRFSIPMYSTVSGESPFICSHQLKRSHCYQKSHDLNFQVEGKKMKKYRMGN